MKRDEFIYQLNNYLKKAPREERETVLSYYTEMLDDRGIGTNMEIPPDISTPRQIAYEILRDIQLGTYAQEVTGTEVKPKKESKNILLIVILSILALPIGLPLAITLIGLAFAFFAVLLSLIIAALAFVISVVAASIAILWSNPFSFVVLLGALGGILFGLGLFLLFISFTRFMLRSIVKSIKNRSARRKNK